ncbi:Hypothetical predicted protein, partial [Paramuricea clavata]
MEDGHEISSSTQKSNNNLILAQSLINLIDNHSEGTDKVMDGNNGETQKLVEELNTEILTTSTAAVKAKLSKDSSAKLHGKRDKIMEYCRYKFPNFPKDKPLRRITRSGGKSANEKLASDIIALVKYCCSEEITVEINELFKKSSSVHPEMSFSSSQGQKITNCTDIDQFTSLAENLDIKLCTLREDFDQTVTCLKDEISELKSDLCAKQAKIQALESELATFKGNCKSSLENTKAKLESCEIELNKNEENIAKHESNFQKLSKDLEKLRKETKEIGKVKSISKNPLAITIENQSSESNKNIYVEAANTILSSEEIKTKKTDKAKSIRENSLATTIEILSPEANKNTYAAAVNINANLSPENHSSVPKTNPTKHSSKDSSQLLKPAKGNNSPNKQHSHEAHSDHSATSSVNDDHDLFVGVEKRKIKRLYLGGVREG